ncbi:MAG TPA: pyridoxamine 5'-phosphate oxidase family protein [Chthoniobacterales bacterium]
MSIPPPDYSSFHIEDCEDVIGLVKTLVDGRHPGILGTVDKDGKPHLRWMATFSFSEFPVFHALTHPQSEKVAQIWENPNVDWMFSNEDLSLVVNLSGKARVLTDTPSLKRIWAKIDDKSHAYFLNQYAKGAGFVAIETVVKAVRCTSPRDDLRFDLETAELARAR